MKYKLLVFDWDGTLMDSEAHIIHCMVLAFADLGLEAPSADAVRNVIGLGLAEAVAGLCTQNQQPLVEELTLAYRRHFFSDASGSSGLFPQVEATLEQLANQGYLLSVATGKSRRGLDKVLRETGLGHFFIATRCADETFSKPHPEMLHQLLDYAGVTPDEAVMIGDTEYDLLMARNAGTDAIGVCYGVHTPERLLGLEPLACLEQIADLPAFLAGDRRR
jgi:phosphoglycolate phosphatase